jgi:F-type H+-transporting ATPase subunit alpha
VVDYEGKMLNWMRSEHKDLLKAIRDSKDLGDDSKAKLVSALATFGKTYA